MKNNSKNLYFVLFIQIFYVLVSSATSITRGPYLQNQSPTQITIKWRTDLPTDSLVTWGQSVDQQHFFQANLKLTTEHEMTISNLNSSTQYYYSVGTSTEILTGNDIEHSFLMPPTHGSQTSFRFWVLGDSGTANANAESVRDAYYNYSKGEKTHLWFMLGDNAYSSGSDTEYQAAVFDMYPNMLKQSTLWPVIGNHDSQNANSITATGIYYDIFSLPDQAHSTGHSLGADSGTEAYYSFNYANTHFIMLESAQASTTFRSAMEAWLSADLSLNQADWTIAMWHHPPYTMGSHNSDIESRHIYMREHILPILESHGVDLVLGGHSHSYERSWLIDSHYGLSDTFDSNTHVIDASSGDPSKGEFYLKPYFGPSANDGSVYVVAGSSGKVGGIEPLPHPAMRNTLALRELGSMVIDVSGHQLQASFLKANGEIDDLFRIVKDDLIFADSFETF